MNDAVAREEITRRVLACDLPTVIVLAVDIYRRKYPEHSVDQFLELARMSWDTYSENSVLG